VLAGICVFLFNAGEDYYVKLVSLNL